MSAPRHPCCPEAPWCRIRVIRVGPRPRVPCVPWLPRADPSLRDPRPRLPLRQSHGLMRANRTKHGGVCGTARAAGDQCVRNFLRRLMNRRQFLERSGQALATIPLVSLGSRFDLLAQGAAPSIPAPVLERLGITTVCFRERFPATRTKGAAAPPEG